MKDYQVAYNVLMQFYPLTLDDLGGEEWRDIEGYVGIYQISNFGRVKSFYGKQPRIMIPKLNNRDYLVLRLNKHSARECLPVHRLVAKAFIPNPDNKPQINHIDGNKLNDYVGNLEWVTAKENTKHAYNIGLVKKGEGHGRAKLTNAQVVYIRDNPDKLSCKALAEKFGVCKATIGRIQLGSRYQNAGGMIREKIDIRTPIEKRNQIRSEYRKGVRGFSIPALAQKYGCNPKTIWNIVNEK